MTEFWSFPPKVTKDAWNALLDHGLYKEASYIISFYTKDSTTYYVAINGKTGKIDYGGENNSGGINGTNASAVISSAINSNDDQLIFFKKADYSLSGLTISKRTHLLGEKGTRFTLSAKPSITTNVVTTFENIEFYTTVEGVGHLKLNSDIEFRDCSFNFPISNHIDSSGVIWFNSSNLKLKNCVITQGGTTSGTENDFVFMEIQHNIDELFVEDFRIKSVNVKEHATIFRVKSGLTLKNFIFENIRWDYLEISGTTEPSVVAFLRHYSPMTIVKFKGYIFLDGSYGAGTPSNQYHAPVFGFAVIDQCIIEDVSLLDFSHPVFQAKHLSMSNYMQIHPSYNSELGLDLGASSTPNLKAEITNLYLENCGMCMNTGWTDLTITGFIFNFGNISLSNEGAVAGQVHRVIVGDGIFLDSGIGFTASDIEVKLHIDNVKAYYTDEGCFIDLPEMSYPVRIYINNFELSPVTAYSRPRFIGDGTSQLTRSSNQTIWIQNSYICTYQPPLNRWNPAQSNDRFVNVKWIDTTDSSIYWSENSGTATFSGDGSTTDFNIAHGLVETPTVVHLEAKTSDAAGDKYWEADDTNITVHFITSPPTGNNNVILSWKAEV